MPRVEYDQWRQLPGSSTWGMLRQMVHMERGELTDKPRWISLYQTVGFTFYGGKGDFIAL